MTGLLNPVSAQTSGTLTKPYLELRDNILHISYSFPEGCKGVYKVWIEAKDMDGNTVEAASVSGDAGTNIEPGLNKKVLWDLKNDSIFLNGTLSVRILATQIPKHLSKTSLLFSSAILPGLGQSIVAEKPFWIAGIATYGVLAGSYWFNRKAADSYQLYIDSEARNQTEDYFNNAVTQNRISKTLAWSALGIWTANMIWIAVMPERSDPGINERTKINLGIKPDVSGFGPDISLFLTINLVR